MVTSTLERATRLDRKALLQELGRLSPEEQRVVYLRFGLTADGSLRTLEEVAEALALSYREVRLLETRALRALRAPVPSVS